VSGLPGFSSSRNNKRGVGCDPYTALSCITQRSQRALAKMRKGRYNADVVQRKLLCMDALTSYTGHGVFQHPMTAAFIILDRVILTLVGEKCNREF